MSAIGFVGTGEMAAPMVRFLAARGHDITVSERNAKIAAELAQHPRVRIAPNQDVVDHSEIVFLSVRPHVARDVLSGLTFRGEHQIISVMAGFGVDALATLCAPATDITLTMPLGFLETGGCPLPAFPDAALLDRLFAPDNPVFATPTQEALNLHIGICAFVASTLDMMDTAARWFGEATGDPAGAAFYTHHLISGYLAALPDAHPGTLAAYRDGLATEGTYSLQLVEALREGGAPDALTAGLNAVRTRLETGS